MKTSVKAANLVNVLDRLGKIKVVDWGIAIECETEEDALLVNYAYRYNKYGSEIVERTDGKFQLTVFNDTAKSSGI